MSVRDGYPWSSVGYFSDPIPGDPGLLEAYASTCSGTATTLERAAGNLNRLQGGETISDAVAAILARASEAAGTLGALQVRYSAIAGAVRGYAPSLKQAQAESLAAVEAASTAKAREKEARNAAIAALPGAASFDEAERKRAVEEYHVQRSRQAAAQAELYSAKAKLAAAIRDRDDAADAAARRIDGVLQDSTLNDSAWDKFVAMASSVVKTLADVATWVWENLDKIAVVLMVVGLLWLASNVVFSGGVVLAISMVALFAARPQPGLAALARTGDAAASFAEHLIRAFREGRTPEPGELAAAVLLIGANGLGLGANLITGRDLHLFDDGEPWVGKAKKVDSQPLDGLGSLAQSIQDTDTQAAGLADGIRVHAVMGDDGLTRYTVVIPGTQEELSSWTGWAGSRTGMDWPANLHAVAFGTSTGSEAVRQALVKAEVPEGAQIMFAGHSQGGILAANLAADESFTSRYQVKGVISFGSPVECAEVPRSIPMLSFEHRGDVVPVLDLSGTESNLTRIELQSPGDPHSLNDNHVMSGYRDSIRDMPANSLNARRADQFMQENSLDKFLSSDEGRIVTTHVEIGRIVE